MKLEILIIFSSIFLFFTAFKENNEREKLTDGTDLYCLGEAVAFAETSGCTAGVARYNNCHGIMFAGEPAIFLEKKDSYEYFYNLWRENYKIYPTVYLAGIYTGNDKPYLWLEAVNQSYQQCLNEL